MGRLCYEARDREEHWVLPMRPAYAACKAVLIWDETAALTGDWKNQDLSARCLTGSVSD